MPIQVGFQHLRFVSIMFIGIATNAKPLCAQEAWPQFRGPGALGVASSNNIPDHWTATENVAWKTDIPGRGWSSPIVTGNRIFLTTVVNLGESEDPKKGLYFGGERLKPPASTHQWKVLCLDLDSGSIRWERMVHEGTPETSIHIKNSFASETPVTDGERIYCCFGNQGIFCFDLEGQPQWDYPLAPHPTRLGWGPAASPTLHDGRLYYCYDNEKESFLICLDAATGKQLWQVPREEKSNWSTPCIWKNQQRVELVTAATGKVVSYDLDGKMLWSLAGMSSITIATPYVVNDLLYVSSGYVMDSARPIYAIKPGASGDITLPKDQLESEFVAWCQPKAAPYNPTTLVYDGRLYSLYDRGIFACYDALTGKEQYSGKRIPNGRAFTSSPWAMNGKIFCLNEDGVTFVFPSGDQFELLHTNPLAEDDMGMATPAIVGDRLLIRTAARMYCIQSKP
jgi:outer membrane protein assembly factor BamB